MAIYASVGVITELHLPAPFMGAIWRTKAVLRTAYLATSYLNCQVGQMEHLQFRSNPSRVPTLSCMRNSGLIMVRFLCMHLQHLMMSNLNSLCLSTGGGLTATYYASSDWTNPKYHDVHTLPISSSSAFAPVSSEIGSTYYSVRWAGLLRINSSIGSKDFIIRAASDIGSCMKIVLNGSICANSCQDPSVPIGSIWGMSQGFNAGLCFAKRTSTKVQFWPIEIYGRSGGVTPTAWDLQWRPLDHLVTHVSEYDVIPTVTVPPLPVQLSISHGERVLMVIGGC